MAGKYADKLIDLSPEHINAQEAKIRLSLIRRDFPEAKKWVDKWKENHPHISIMDKEKWDYPLEELKNELE